MNFEDLDKDTQDIIDGMCHNTGKTREQAILALVEFGMLSMIAAVSPAHFLNNKRKRIIEVIANVVNADPEMQQTAKAYEAHWDLNV